MQQTGNRLYESSHLTDNITITEKAGIIEEHQLKRIAGPEASLQLK